MFANSVDPDQAAPKLDLGLHCLLSHDIRIFTANTVLIPDQSDKLYINDTPAVPKISN